MFETTSLRSAALSLTGNPNATKNPACGKLLTLLKAGKLAAGFELSLQNKSIWVALSAAFWTRVTDSDFNVLRRTDSKPTNGSFLVSFERCADAVVNAVAEEFKDHVGDSRLLIELLGQHARHEVRIKSDDWNSYASTLRSRMPEKSKGGRHEKTSWGHLVPLVADYVFQEASQKRPIKSEAAAEAVLAEAKAMGIADLPERRTLQETFDKMKTRK